MWVKESFAFYKVIQPRERYRRANISCTEKKKTILYLISIADTICVIEERFGLSPHWVLLNVQLVLPHKRTGVS